MAGLTINSPCSWTIVVKIYKYNPLKINTIFIDAQYKLNASTAGTEQYNLPEVGTIFQKTILPSTQDTIPLSVLDQNLTN